MKITGALEDILMLLKLATLIEDTLPELNRLVLMQNIHIIISRLPDPSNYYNKWCKYWIISTSIVILLNKSSTEVALQCRLTFITTCNYTYTYMDKYRKAHKGTCRCVP